MDGAMKVFFERSLNLNDFSIVFQNSASIDCFDFYLEVKDPAFMAIQNCPSDNLYHAATGNSKTNQVNGAQVFMVPSRSPIIQLCGSENLFWGSLVGGRKTAYLQQLTLRRITYPMELLHHQSKSDGFEKDFAIKAPVQWHLMVPRPCCSNRDRKPCIRSPKSFLSPNINFLEQPPNRFVGLPSPNSKFFGKTNGLKSVFPSNMFYV